MSFRISSIANAGDLSKERLVLRADEALDVGAYAIFCCWAADGDEVSSGDLPAAYWFEDQKVGKGDLIVLYTKSGKRSSKLSDRGKTSHFFYWGRQSTLWVEGKRPVLANTKPYLFGPLPASEK